jgi:hypothetical protein
MSVMVMPVNMTSCVCRTLRRPALQGELDFSLRIHRQSSSDRRASLTIAGACP